jgi:hypothetical protein
MATERPKQPTSPDVSVARLLDDIGAPDFEYYSAGEERVVGEALRAWPLLAAVTRSLRAGGTAQRVYGAPSTFRVIEPPSETNADGDASRKEPG